MLHSGPSIKKKRRKGKRQIKGIHEAIGNGEVGDKKGGRPIVEGGTSAKKIEIANRSE